MCNCDEYNHDYYWQFWGVPRTNSDKNLAIQWDGGKGSCHGLCHVQQIFFVCTVSHSFFLFFGLTF